MKYNMHKFECMAKLIGKGNLRCRNDVETRIQWDK